MSLTVNGELQIAAFLNGINLLSLTIITFQAYLIQDTVHNHHMFLLIVSEEASKRSVKCILN